MQPPKILITVGTTEFDPLIEYTSSPHFLTLLKNNGFADCPITYQIGGKGTIIPTNGSHFRLSSDIQQVYDEHQIIFTHGGAGTLLCCLTHGPKGRKIVAIANDTLAGNHQIELINKLHKEGYLLGFCSVGDMMKNQSKLLSYLRGQLPIREYETPHRCIMNDLIFGS